MSLNTSALSTSPLSNASPIFSGLTSRRRSSGASSLSIAPSLKLASPRNGKSSLLGQSLRPEEKKVKQLVIKNIRSRPTHESSQDFITASLNTLVRAVRAILSDPPQPTPESLQALYALCEGVVGASSSSAASSTAQDSVAQTLYDRIRIEIERKVGEYASTLRGLESATGEAWLKKLDGMWRSFTEKMLLVRSVLLHLDRTFVLAKPGLLSLWDLGLDIFSHRIVTDEVIGAKLTQEMIHLINRERCGETISQALVTTLISLLTTISTSVYTTAFATPYLASSKNYYAREAETLLGISDVATADGDTQAQSMAVPQYLRHVQKRLKEEGERCDVVIGSTSKGQVLRIVEQQLIGELAEVLLQRGLSDMITQALLPDLLSMYSLFARVGALSKLRAAFGQHVKDRGTAIVTDASKDDSMVDMLIAFQALVNTVLRDSFAMDPDFSRASRDAFGVFINARQNKPAEMIAKFIDAKMKAGNKAMSDADLEQTFRDVLNLFRYCQGKDIFEAFYKKDFAKRLLLNRSASSDAEKSMLLKLKEECGAAFTAKLETMAKDIDLSSDVMSSYRSSLTAERSPLSTVSVNILTAGNWPSYSKMPCVLPQALQEELQRFGLFYKHKYAGRSLSWVHGLDHCQLRADFGPGKGGGRKELNVSLAQTLVILLFNDKGDGEKISFKDILVQTGLEHKEACRTLQSLACAKYKILNKHPKGREVDDTDEFSFNSGFRDDKYRIRVNQIQAKETVEEQKATEKQVLLDRQSHLQLVIVRILKARKTIKHTELIMETVNTLKQRFRVDPPEIKKAIDSLLDRDYMERNGRDSYNYLA